MNMKSDIKNIVGENIRKCRQNLGLSQEELATKAKLHRTYIGGVERGERNITIESLNRITDALNINIEEVFHEEDKNV